MPTVPGNFARQRLTLVLKCSTWDTNPNQRLPISRRRRVTRPVLGVRDSPFCSVREAFICRPLDSALGRLRSVHWAYGVAGTAVDALLGVDHIGLPLGDAVHRTFRNTCPTGNALFMDKVSQQSHLPLLVLKHCNTSVREVNPTRVPACATFL